MKTGQRPRQSAQFITFPYCAPASKIAILLLSNPFSVCAIAFGKPNEFILVFFSIIQKKKKKNNNKNLIQAWMMWANV